MKNNRNLSGASIQDPSTIHNLEYNDAAGSKKVSEVGRHLLPIPYISGGAVAYTTDATTARNLEPGKCLAVYNNSTLGSITLSSDGSAAALASGVTDASGNVGIPCAAGAWTYIAMANQRWVKASAATLLVFVIDDNTAIKQESAR